MTDAMQMLHSQLWNIVHHLVTHPPEEVELAVAMGMKPIAKQDVFKKTVNLSNITSDLENH